MKYQLFRPTFLLGIDVSQNAIRILELNKKGNGITTWVNVPLLKQHPQEVDNIVATLKLALAPQQFKTRMVNLALSYSAIIHKTITLPAPLNPREITEFLTLNLEKYIGIAKNQISFDYHVAARSAEHTIIDLIAVRKERIAKCQAILAAVNLQPKVIDIDAFALARMLNIIYRPSQPMVAINLDYGAILICVFTVDKMLYAHEEFIEDTNLTAQLNDYLWHYLQMAVATLQQPPQQLILSGEYAARVDREKIAAWAHFPVALVNTKAQFNLPAPDLAIALGLALRRNYVAT